MAPVNRTHEDLDAAIRAHLAEELEGHIVVDWVVITASDSLEEMDDEETTYYQATRYGQRPHTTRGLISTAIELDKGTAHD